MAEVSSITYSSEDRFEITFTFSTSLSKSDYFAVQNQKSQFGLDDLYVSIPIPI